MIDPSCSLTSNDTHVMGTISINTCGTEMEVCLLMFNLLLLVYFVLLWTYKPNYLPTTLKSSLFSQEEGDFIIFRNSISSFDAPSAIITRRGQVKIGFSCQYPKVVDVYSHYLNKKSDYIFTEVNFGSFGYVFEVFTDSNFATAVAPETYPVEYQLLDMIYMGIKAQSTLSNTRLFVESCRATPTGNPKNIKYYDLISHG